MARRHSPSSQASTLLFHQEVSRDTKGLTGKGQLQQVGSPIASYSLKHFSPTEGQMRWEREKRKSSPSNQADGNNMKKAH